VSSTGHTSTPEVFVVDDDPSVQLLIRAWLESAGYQVRSFSTGASVLRALAESEPAALCLDVSMPGMDGIEVLSQLRRQGRDTPVVMLTALDALETAVECMRLGARDYMLKPLDRATFLANIKRVCGAPTATLPDLSDSRTEAAPGMIGGSAPMTELYRQIERVAGSRISVFIGGESGTGKELVARAIHALGRADAGPFVAINCGAIPESLQESELFGHEKGAFTGALSTRPGRFEQAQGGTLLLDEVGELSPAAQVGLLRVLQERCVERVGGTRTIDLDVRVVSATHRDLRAAVSTGSFREDLYYRLVVYPIEVPPLRDRVEDIPLLAAHFLAKHRADLDRQLSGLRPDALDRLCLHSWPGNVRELENVIHGAMVRSDGPWISARDLPLPSGPRPVQHPNPNLNPNPGLNLNPSSSPNPGSGSGPVPGPVEPRLEPENPARTQPEPRTPVSIQDMERRTILAAIEACDGNITQTAKRLGIGRATLYRKLDRYKLR